jgi:hypothetical protein
VADDRYVPHDRYLPHDRYGGDVLAAGWQQAGKPLSVNLTLSRGLVVEDPSSGFVGAVQRWENGLVLLEDRKGRKRSFPLGPGFWYEGRPVTLVLPAPEPATTIRRTASGSIAGPIATRAKVAVPSRIYVEGRHDAELVEKIWGADLRDVGVVVELLGGVDQLPEVVEEFRPEPTRRLGVLVDHLVTGSKETRIAHAVANQPGGRHVLVLGHPYVDVWQAVKPARVGLARWPDIPRDVEWKHGICEVLGLPHDDQADIAAAWRKILARVNSWRDLEQPLLNVVEQLIDFVTVEP